MKRKYFKNIKNIKISISKVSHFAHPTSMNHLYRENILDHFKNPRNFGRLKNPDFSHEENNPLCGDRIGMEIKLRTKNEQVSRFTTNAVVNRRSCDARLEALGASKTGSRNFEIPIRELRTIKEVRFYGEGCAISMAAASMLTEKVLGKEIGEIKRLGPKDMLEMLGICPTPTRLKCALLPLEVLQKALS